MLAVFAPTGRSARPARANRALDLVIANKNAPRQCVLSGPAAEIERARQLCAERRITTHPVAVSAAFHSRLVAGAARPFWMSSSSINFLARRFRSSRTRRPLPTPAMRAAARASGRPARASRSSSSPRSKRCTGLGRGRSSRSALTHEAHRSRSQRSSRARPHAAAAVDALARRGGKRLRSGLLARNLGRSRVCCRPRPVGLGAGIASPASKTAGIDRENQRCQRQAQEQHDRCSFREPPIHARTTASAVASAGGDEHAAVLDRGAARRIAAN